MKQTTLIFCLLMLTVSIKAQQTTQETRNVKTTTEVIIITGEALKYYQNALDGDARAQNNLGACYYNGDGVTQDKAKGIELLRKASRQGDKSAQDNLRKLGYDW